MNEPDTRRARRFVIPEFQRPYTWELLPWTRRRCEQRGSRRAAIDDASRAPGVSRISDQRRDLGEDRPCNHLRTIEHPNRSTNASTVIEAACQGSLDRRRGVGRSGQTKGVLTPYRTADA